MSEPTKKLFLLDAMALIYRAFYALNKNPRINSKGLNTSAILGFANALLDILKNDKPTHIGVAFDTMAPTVRHGDFPEYKGNRQAMPEDLSKAIPYIKKLIEAFNIPILFVDGYEADDVIGTLAKEAEKKGFAVYMVTPDKDFGQLVSDNITIIKPAKFGDKPVHMGPKEVCERFGIQRPEQVIDMLGLWGDASDNIPGIAGVGEATARKLLAQFDTLENVLEHADEIANEKLREKVIASRESAIFSKQLATIILNVPIPLEPEQLLYSAPDEIALRQLLEELEFRALAKRIFGDSASIQPATKVTERGPDLFGDAISIEENDADNPSVTGDLENISTIKHNYHLTDTPEKRKVLILRLQNVAMFCFDTETTGLDPNKSELVGLSFAIEPHEAWYIPLPENYSEAAAIVSEFRELFADPAIGKTGQNMKFDIAMLRWYDIVVKGTLFDTMLAHYLIQPDDRHGMDFLARKFLNYEPVPIEALIGKKGREQMTMRLADPLLVKEYAAEDADITLQLRMALEPGLSATGTLDLFEKIEMPLMPVLAAMEAEGVRLNSAALDEFSVQLKTEIVLLEQEIFTHAGVKFNIASPKQLGEILFDKLKITDKTRQTKTKQYATGEDILVKLVNKHPIVQLILDYRSLTKLKSTYVDSLPLLVNPRTGRIHTSYNQAVAATGRLSSNNPNLQNIPIRTERGREIRKAFVPRSSNYVLMSADYSQIELRIIAEMSGDKGMLSAFTRGIDIHTATAANIYSVSPEEVTKDMRRNAKTVNFGIVYGISAYGLSEQLNIPRGEAAEIIRQYFEKFPGIKEYMDKTIAFARENGYVETMMKRRRYIRDINSANANMRGFAERNAINAPIQGSSADMIKIAMIRIHNALNGQNLRSRMIMQVHDELVFDVHREEIEIVKPLIHKMMKEAIPMSVPVEVDINTGENWLEAH
ncbi:MAG: DNA polymerase I [Bacteroidales bacterium]